MMRRTATRLAAFTGALLGCKAPLSSAQAPSTLAALQGATVVDLSHRLDSSTLYWPASPSAFELETLSHGHTEAGYFYSANLAAAHNAVGLDRRRLRLAGTRRGAGAVAVCAARFDRTMRQRPPIPSTAADCVPRSCRDSSTIC